MSLKKLVIFGDGEFAEIAYEYFTYDSEYQVAGFCVDPDYLLKSEMNGKPVFSSALLEECYPPSDYALFIAIPSTNLNRLRTRVYLDAKVKGYSFATYISSRAFVWRNTTIGENTFIFENNVLQPFVRIGNNCILWSGNHIGHRSIVEDNVFIASHAVISGYCVIESGCFIGVNATINDHVRVAENCIIGSGALISKDTDKERIYVGLGSRPVPGKSSFESDLS